jgi:hypothetical protein
MKVSRRAFLLTGVVTATAVGLGGLWVQVFCSKRATQGAANSLITHIESRELAPSDISIRLAAVLEDRESAAYVGAAYLRKFPSEASVASLSELLEQRLGTKVRAASCTEPLQAVVAQQCRTDFDDENFVIVDGWMLAHTEAQICALIALRG